MAGVIEETYARIRSFDVQGARNIAHSGLAALREAASGYKGKDSGKFRGSLKGWADTLASARPTEPMLRNGLKYALHSARGRRPAGCERVAGIKKSVLAAIDGYLDESKKAIERIVEYGSKKIEDGFVIMTHCHSSTVTRIMKRAKEEGKSFEVYVSETRPLFQGRRTAAELAGLGIPVTSMIDSAQRTFIRKADLALVGSDALTADGYLVNKVGTSMLALACEEAGVPFGAAAELFKFDPITVVGYREPIEERGPKEVWGEAPPGVRVVNPSFDFIPPRYIRFLITEAGVLSPYAVAIAASKKYPWMMGE